MTSEKRPVGRPARLTLEQCQEVSRLHYEEGISYQKLANQFQVGVGTIDRALRKIAS
ncbi:helix-turn-helix domain-containing protein [Microbacterium sp. HMWF026]|uniref:helix-turn-helix domain-containing protein n=1 Tax=Microbacterium sp. HMWF026 TaxID=2056861 RepID=UPI0035C15A7D